MVLETRLGRIGHLVCCAYGLTRLVGSAFEVLLGTNLVRHSSRLILAFALCDRLKDRIWLQILHFLVQFDRFLECMSLVHHIFILN